MRWQVAGARYQGPVCRALLLCAWTALFGLRLYGAARPRYGGTLRLSFFQAAETYDPALAATLPEQLVSRAVYETLVTLNQEGAVAPGLAVNWLSESGGKRWIFQLRPGVRFHNGAPLTAAAARASLERSLAQAQSGAAARLRALQFLCASPFPNRLACDLAEPLAAPEMLADPALAIADADGAGTGAWKVAAWTKGKQVRLEAFEGHFRGRPFLAAVEAEFGSDPRRQRVDFELKRADVLVAAPTEARATGQARAPQPANLLLLGFPPRPARPNAPGDSGRDPRRFIQAMLDREALARLLPPGRADAAEAFLPNWVSGYGFLFARPLVRPIEGPPPHGAFRLIYDESDPVARLIASRLALDLRTIGVELRPEGLPHAAFGQARDSGQYDLFVESIRLRVENPAAALAGIVQRYEPEKLPAELFLQPGRGGSAGLELQYRIEQAALSGLRVIPLLHYRDQYSFQAGLEQVRLDHNGMLDLANAWKK